MAETQTRRISLEEDFLNFKTNDLLYGFMRSLSTARPEIENGQAVKTANGKTKYREYLPIKTFKKNKKLIAGILNVNPKTIGNQLEKLLESGLVDQGIEEMNGTDCECYWFPYDEDGRYKIVEKEVIEYLVHTRNAHAIRIYLYLLSKYQWKKDYIFTIQELKEALGYAESTKSCDALIRNVLASFKAEGILKFTTVECQIDSSDDLRAKTYRMKLEYVCASSSELPSRNFN